MILLLLLISPRALSNESFFLPIRATTPKLSAEGGVIQNSFYNLETEKSKQFFPKKKIAYDYGTQSHHKYRPRSRVFGSFGHCVVGGRNKIGSRFNASIY